METLPTKKSIAEHKLYGITLPPLKVITGSRKQPPFWGKTCSSLLYPADESVRRHLLREGAVFGVSKRRFCRRRSGAAGCLHTDGCRSHGHEKCLCLLDEGAALHPSNTLAVSWKIREHAFNKTRGAGHPGMPHPGPLSPASWLLSPIMAPPGPSRLPG